MIPEEGPIIPLELAKDSSTDNVFEYAIVKPLGLVDLSSTVGGSDLWNT